MSSEPLVSIIIPCYNAVKMIERCLQSCFEQVHPNIEIIIVDNNSKDGSSEFANVLASTANRRVIFTQCKEQGQNYAFNHGFTLAQGDYVQWLDADDELTPNKIALQVTALEENSNFDIAYGEWEWCFYQEQQCQFRLAFPSMQYDDYLLQTLLHNWQPPLSYLLRRKAAKHLQALFAWNPETKSSTDREYYTIAAIIGLRFLYVPHTNVRYNFWSPAQVSRRVSYVLRVECLKQMFLRFQEIAAIQPADRITEQHWSKLKQNWDIWKLAPVTLIQKTQRCFFLQHCQTQSGIPLNEAEARIVGALQQASGAYTLEDHAHGIVHLMMQHILQQPSINTSSVVAELSRCVGIEHPLSPEPPDQKLPQSDTQNVTQLRALINAIPWFAPLFGEQRSAVLSVLDKLRLNGLLNQINPTQSH